MREPFSKFIKMKLGDGLLLITCGLPATMKTETSEEISKIKGYPIIRSDLVRKEVLQNEDIFDEKIASSMDKRLLVYDETFRQAEESLSKKGNVIIDATFITQSLRRRAASIADRHNKAFVILQTQRPRGIALAKIAGRSKEDYESNALTEQAYVNNEKKFEEVDIEDLKALYPQLSIIHLLLDTTQDTPGEWYIIGLKKR